MINSEQAISTIKSKLEDVRSVDDQVLMGVKRYGSRPYAVYYVDMSDNIEKRAQTLSEFQDHCLGKRFFEKGTSISRYVSII